MKISVEEFHKLLTIFQGPPTCLTVKQTKMRAAQWRRNCKQRKKNQTPKAKARSAAFFARNRQE
jgi:hypothetical protein